VAEVEQLFDLNNDPRAKQRLLGGEINFARCQSCGFQGPLSTPVVYHDPEKELLLTYFPPELGLPVNEQERILGPMISQVTNRLPPEKRKAYLLRPQSMFTYDTLIERILAGDGITKEMIQGQQQRLALLQRLLTTTSPESRSEVIRQEEKLIDREFFTILSQVVEASLAQADERSARAMAGLQQELLEQTEYGRKLKNDAKEAEQTVKALQDATKEGLTREKLMDLIIAAAPSETSLTTLVSLARSGMDYEFFSLLTKRIEKASPAEKEQLVNLRGKLLQLTQEIDKAIDEHVKQTNQVIEELLKINNLEEVLSQNIQIVDEYFMQAVKSQLDLARQAGNFERSAKLQNIITTVEKLSAPPPEVALAQELFDAGTPEEIEKIISANGEKINDDFVQLLSGLAMQSEQQGQPEEVINHFKTIYRSVLRHTMRQNLQS